MASPMVRRRRLAAELREIRETANRSADAVARALGWSPSKMSRYEKALTALKPSDVARLLDQYGVRGERRAFLLRLADEAGRKAWWEESRLELTPYHQEYIGFEQEAWLIATWQVEVVPGLLQTEPYARHLIGNYGVIEPIAPGQVERLVTVRLRRQEVLTGESPVQLSVVLDESILQRRIGDDQVMRDQLVHLGRLAERPNVTMRVLPVDAQHTVLGPAFSIFRFGPDGDAILADIVAIEHLKNIVIVDNERETHLHWLVFEALASISMDAAASRAAIAEAARSWADGRTAGGE
jgi:transcriptional regulator with XRE-family HTH domain